MENIRDWKTIDRWEKDIVSSKKTIAYFQQAIIEHEKKNNQSINFINEQQGILNILTKAFEEKNGINFFNAKKLVENIYNPSSKYNLKEYSQIDNIIMQIDAENFFINYRIEMINKHKRFIEDTTKWIMSMEKELEKFKR